MFVYSTALGFYCDRVLVVGVAWIFDCIRWG